MSGRVRGGLTERQRAECYSVREAAARLGVSPTAIYDAVKAGKFPFDHFRIGARVVIPRAAIDARLGGAPAPAQPEPQRKEVTRREVI